MLLKTGKRLGTRLFCLLAILVVLCSAFLLMPAQHARADSPNPPNDYPANLDSPAAQDSLTDPWGFYNRECVSFAAWRLNHNNGLPFKNTNYLGKGQTFGSAVTWGSVAQSIGVPVDTTPEVGAVAWWKFSETSGHVAWVSKINTDGSVVVQDYNWSYDGTFLEHKLTSAPTKYIHFGGTVGSAPPPSPGYDLRQFFQNSNGSWSSADPSGATGVQIAGNPAVGNGGIWARDKNGHLRQFYVSNGSWVADDITNATSLVYVSGDPATSSGGVWVRDTNGDLRQFYVGSNGWTAFDATLAVTPNVKVAGNPVVTSGGIYVRDTNNHLRQFYNGSNGWTSFDVSGATGIAMYGDPSIGSNGIFVKDTWGHLQRLYVGTNGWTAYDLTNAAGGVTIYSNPAVDLGGNVWVDDSNGRLRQFYPGSGTSWVAADISGATNGTLISSTPAVGNGGTWARDSNNHLRQFTVVNGSWVANDISSPSNANVTVALDPVVDPGGGMWEAS